MLALVLAAALLPGTAAPARVEASGPLQGAQYEVARLASSARGEISVAAETLDGSATLLIDGDKAYTREHRNLPGYRAFFRQARLSDSTRRRDRGATPVPR